MPHTHCVTIHTVSHVFLIKVTVLPVILQHVVIQEKMGFEIGWIWCKLLRTPSFPASDKEM
jgi:hypothetical protein